MSQNGSGNRKWMEGRGEKVVGGTQIWSFDIDMRSIEIQFREYFTVQFVKREEDGGGGGSGFHICYCNAIVWIIDWHLFLVVNPILKLFFPSDRLITYILCLICKTCWGGGGDAEIQHRNIAMRGIVYEVFKDADFNFHIIFHFRTTPIPSYHLFSDFNLSKKYKFQYLISHFPTQYRKKNLNVDMKKKSLKGKFRMYLEINSQIFDTSSNLIPFTIRRKNLPFSPSIGNFFDGKNSPTFFLYFRLNFHPKGSLCSEITYNTDTRPTQRLRVTSLVERVNSRL